MTHISRPFQIALVAMALFVAVWFLALRGHSTGSEGAGSSASSSAGRAAPAAKRHPPKRRAPADQPRPARSTTARHRASRA